MITASRGLKFSSAIALVQSGQRAARAAWGEDGSSWITLSSASGSSPAIYRESQGSSLEWVPTQEDMLAGDWFAFNGVEV